MLIVAVALFAVFRSGVCIGLFQSSGSHDDDFGVDSRTSAQTEPSDSCGSVLRRLQDLSLNIMSRISKRSRSNADVYDL